MFIVSVFTSNGQCVRIAAKRRLVIEVVLFSVVALRH